VRTLENAMVVPIHDMQNSTGFGPVKVRALQVPDLTAPYYQARTDLCYLWQSHWQEATIHLCFLQSRQRLLLPDFILSSSIRLALSLMIKLRTNRAKNVSLTKMTRKNQTTSKSSNLSFFTKHLKFIQNLEIGMSKTSNKAKKRARDNAKSKK